MEAETTCPICGFHIEATTDRELFEALWLHVRDEHGNGLLADPLVLSAESQEEDQEDARIRNDRYRSF